MPLNFMILCPLLVQQTRHITITGQNTPRSTKDHFVIKDGLEYSGTHLLIDLWGASQLDDVQHIRRTLEACVVACNASLLHIHCHQFSDTGGISGVAVLAESHISVHTWPERAYAAFDVFMCGDAQAENAIEVLKQAFTPEKVTINTLLRGHQDDV